MSILALGLGSGDLRVAVSASTAPDSDGATHRAATAPAWRVEHAPVVTGPVGEFTDVSCPSRRFCVAVGDRNSDASSGGVVEVWNGSRWRFGAVPTPAAVELEGIDCLSRLFCAAVGTSLRSPDGMVLTWDGMRWRRQKIAVQPGFDIALMLDVSCSSPKACTAVGLMAVFVGGEVSARHPTAAAPESAPLLARWNGRRWTDQHQAAAARTSPILTSVSCPADAACVAVGHRGSDESLKPLIERWGHAGWSVQHAVTDPGFHLGVLSSVSCPTVSACVAVGSEGPHPLTEVWDGTTWTTRPFAPDRGTPTSFVVSSVSCTSSANCVAIADSLRASPSKTTTVPVGETWNGTTWSRQPARLAQPNTRLDGLDCAAASACTIVGAGGPNFPVPFAAAWDGQTWTASHPPAPRVALAATFTAVSCPTPITCVAVGWRAQSPFDEDAHTAFVVRRTRTGWHQQRMTSVPHTLFQELTSVSCPSRRWCVATGSTATRGFVQRWNGRAWRRSGAPSPPIGRRDTSGFSAASCPSRRFCVLIGATQKFRSGHNRLFAAVGRPRHWKRFNLPLPLRTYKEVSALSCRNRNDCLAVGNLTDRGAAFSVHWDGTRWTSTLLRPPRKSVIVSLDSVSCPPRGGCVAVGGLGPRLIARAWHDGSWHRLARLPHLSFKTEVPGISCPLASSCTAVGSAAGGPVAVRWNGRRWRVVSRGPASVRKLGFSSVSCPTARTCTAVGGDVNFNSFVSAPLIERSRTSR